jgi:ABC-type amino acid transport system permease subunit
MPIGMSWSSPVTKPSEVVVMARHGVKAVLSGRIRDVNGLDYSQIETASAREFKSSQIFRLITLPQLLRNSVPASTN